MPTSASPAVARTLRRLTALGAAGALCGPCAQATATAAGHTAIDVQHIALELRFDEAARQAHGRATLTLAALAATDELRLDAVQLAIESVRLGATTLGFDLDPAAEDRALRVRLPRLVAAGETLTLEIRYRTGWINETDPDATWGSNGRGLRFLGPSPSDARRKREIWVGNEPGSTRRWFPGHDVPHDLRTSELAATVPRPLQVVAGGRLVGIDEHADGTRTFRFRTDTPEPNHRTSFVVGEFVEVAAEADGVALSSLGYPDERHGLVPSVAALPDMLRFLRGLLGAPFPHPRYTQVFVQELPWHTLGTGLAVNTENMIDDAGTHADFLYLWHGLQAESLAQQWLGGLVVPCDWRDAWLERGLAHHLFGMWTEHLHGAAEFQLWVLQADQATALADAAQGTHEALVEPAPADLAAFVNGNAPYARAGAVLQMLRRQLGEARWREALRRFVARHTGGIACTAQFQRVAEEVAGAPLGAFFAQWVHGRGHPAFEVTEAHDVARGLLVLTLKQAQGPATDPSRQVAFFQGPIEIEIDGRRERVQLAPQAENRFEFASAQPPRLVVVDPDGTWLKRLKHPKPLEAWLHQYRQASAAPARQAALVELAQASRDASRPTAERDAIIEALRQGAASPRYWRERFNALTQLATLLAAPPGASAAAAPTAPSAQPAASVATVALPPALEATLLAIVRDERSWLRAAALRVLGLARSERHAPLFLAHLADESDRVVNAAAIALGRSGSAQAYPALKALPARPSWKNQSWISALAGLKELGDARGVELALAALADPTAARWTLVTPIWDLRIAAAETLVALGAAARGHDIVAARFVRALEQRHVNDLFTQLHLLVTLGDERAVPLVERLRTQSAGDAKAVAVVERQGQALAQKLAAKLAPTDKR